MAAGRVKWHTALSNLRTDLAVVRKMRLAILMVNVLHAMRRNLSPVAQIVGARIGAIGCQRRETDLAIPPLR
jgi:hypothetical protein